MNTAPPDTLLGQLALDCIVSTAKECPAGCFVEFGVYKGGSAWHLLRLAEEQGRELHLYDTFDGIPYRGEFDSHKVGDFADVNYEAVVAALPGAHFHRGIFPDSLAPMPPIAFAHIDADQYQSIKAALTHLGPLMVKGGAMLFDDVPVLEGATRALNESGLPYEITWSNKALVRF